MDPEWLEIITQSMKHITLDKTVKTTKIRIKSEEREYNELLEKHYQEDNNYISMMVIDNNLRMIETTHDDKIEDEFVSYNLFLAIKYKKYICFDINNKMYDDLNRVEKNKLRVISKKVHDVIPLVKNKLIHKKKKIKSIRKLNLAIKYFINGQIEEDLSKITQNIRRIKIKKTL